jgi:hypothetical protein
LTGTPGFCEVMSLIPSTAIGRSPETAAWYEDVESGVMRMSFAAMACSQVIHLSSPHAERWLARKEAASPSACGLSIASLPFHLGWANS